MEQVKEFATEYAENASKGLEVDQEAVGLVGQAANGIVDYSEKIDARYIVVVPRKTFAGWQGPIRKGGAVGPT